MKSLASLCAAALCAALAHPAALAADVEWRVVLAKDGRILLPQLPPAAGIAGYDYVGLGGSGAGLLGFALDQYSSDGPDGLWAQQGNQLVPVAQLGTTDATGPGRSGAQAGDVFTRLDHVADAGGLGIRVFGGDAGDPAAPESATRGLWKATGTLNREFARLYTEGDLGPGALGAGWRYTRFNNAASTADYQVYALPRRRALFAGRVARPDQADNDGDDGLSVLTPGVGNKPCLLDESTLPDYGPGLGSLTFSDIASKPEISRRGEVYSFAQVYDPDAILYYRGIWQLCDGAPRVAALTGATGAAGPGFGDATASFDGLWNGGYDRIAPSVPGGFYFSASGVGSSAAGAAPFYGLFHHADGRNAPVVLENRSDGFGPNLPGYVFSNGSAPYVVQAAGRYAVINAIAAPAADPQSSVRGLWRLTPQTHAEPIAIIGDTGAYAPASGRVWRDFFESAVFDNGDVLIVANVSNPDETSMWRLGVGRPPVEILKKGDLVKVPTAGGLVDAAVTDVAIDNTGILPSAGTDTWYTANGEVVYGVGVAGYNAGVVRGLASRPDYLFDADFD